MRMSSPTRRHQAGFTLVEVLIAMALVGVVLSMAMTGFMHSKKVSDLTRSKIIAQDQASHGLQKLALILKKASIVYFTGRPITGTFDDDGDVAANLPPTIPAGTMDNNFLGAIPLTLATAGGAASTRVPYNFTDPTDRNYNGTAFWVNYGISAYRFQSAAANAVPAGGAGPGGRAFLNSNALRLRTAQPGPYARGDFDQYFSSPLLYMAEAVFPSSEPDPNAGASQGQNIGSNYPWRWNFYVLYLAPMRLSGRTDAQIPLTGRTEDLGGTGNARWARSTVPLQLRLLTIEGVQATLNVNATPSGIPSPTTAASPANTGWRRNNRGVLQAPFDQPNGQVNYHPFEIRTEDVDTTTPNNGAYRVLLNTSATLGTPSGMRVAGSSIHPNFGNLGNDPPTDTVFTNSTPSRVMDQVIADYVDPDNIHGTSVRIFNPTAAAGQAWVNAYNPNTGFLYLNNGNRPSRALVSIATRYRNTRQVPFQFASESLEIELEALTRYQSINYMSQL